jgi:acetylornithine deacetylase/succinyl-diaminopimelate desuccinylase-like protein
MSLLDPAPVLARIEQDFPQSVERLKELLRFPSIGTDPAHDADTRACAAWCAERLRALGFEASVRPTIGQPMVVGHHPAASPDAPHILYYGHYDVQPVDPLGLWEHPPFEPVVVEGRHGPRIQARGAVDDKGQVMTFLEAFAAWKAVHGSLPCRVTVFLEGEEEGSSPSLVPFIETNRDELRSDAIVVSDTGMLGPDEPAITTSLRGLCYLEISLRGATHDLHSGLFGGIVANPLNELTRALASLVDERGRVTVEGFYDGVREPDPAVVDSWKAVRWSEAEVLEGVGLRLPTGERDRPFLERAWTRPTLDIHGLWGGYMGEGTKTVIPCLAHAKLSCRLVPGQDPAAMPGRIERHLRARVPADMQLTVTDLGSTRGIEVASDQPFMAAARLGVRDAFGKDPVLMGCGASIPVVGVFQDLLGKDALLVGFGLEDDKVHSPNEKFDLVCYRKGILTHAAMLARFAEVGRTG